MVPGTVFFLIYLDLLFFFYFNKFINTIYKATVLRMENNVEVIMDDVVFRNNYGPVRKCKIYISLLFHFDY